MQMLKISQMDVGFGGEAPAVEALVLDSPESVVGSAGLVGALHADCVMNSEGWQLRFKRAQLLHTGFFSSHRVWRALQVKLSAAD
jgi:hypothetical protein